MTPFETQVAALRAKFPETRITSLANGSSLVEVQRYEMPQGWDRNEATLLFLVSASYPAAQPDCFWIEPGPVRLPGNRTPQNTNDTNEIPGVGQRGTWFSWHLQNWNPNTDTLLTYMRAIRRRLDPAR